MEGRQPWKANEMSALLLQACESSTDSVRDADNLGESVKGSKFDLVGRSVKILKLHVIVQGYREKKRLFFQPFLIHLCAESEVSTEEECYWKQPRRSSKSFRCMTNRKRSNLNDAKMPLTELVRTGDVIADAVCQREHSRTDKA